MDDYKMIQQLGSKKAFISRIYSRIAFVTGKPPEDFGIVDCHTANPKAGDPSNGVNPLVMSAF